MCRRIEKGPLPKFVNAENVHVWQYGKYYIYKQLKQEIFHNL